MKELAERLVDAIEGESGGPHPGHRAAHAKGTLLAGTFTPSAEAARLTTAAHFAGDPVRVTARFSNGSGNPGAPDNHRLQGRGIAVKFYLPEGGTADIVMLTLPVFWARTPEEFEQFVLTRRRDPHTGEPDPEALGRFLAENPASQAALGSILPTLVPPRSYATCVYNSIHSFGLVDRAGATRWIRWRWLPEAGVDVLSDEEIAAAGSDYLQEEIVERLPVRFTLVARLAEAGDPIDDPTTAWPEEREAVAMGTLELTGPETERERDGDVLVFDPTRVVDGILLSEDPILHVRSHAYSVSVERRSGIPRPA